MLFPRCLCILEEIKISVIPTIVWDGDQVVLELSKGGSVKKRYVRGNALVFADEGESTKKSYYVTDPHGNVVQLLDEAGSVTKTYEYDSFGNEVNPDKKDENAFRYCGEYYDKETEEVYLRARYYVPSVGRFLTRDTYTGETDEPLSLHLYMYCENDGVNAWDPSGHCYVTQYAYVENGKIKYEKYWDRNCAIELHKYLGNKKLKGPMYRKNTEWIKKITSISSEFDMQIMKFKEVFLKEKQHYESIAKKQMFRLN